MASLTPTQSHALFDILTHHETYAEIEAFKQPDAIKTYGPPFQDAIPSSSSQTAPVLQTLLSTFILTLPGLRDVSSTFWKTQVYDLIQELSAAELSESYDKGVLGIRKTLATAISALVEYPARGVLDGLPKDEERLKRSRSEYDVNKAEDVLRSWQDCLQGLVYGDLVGEIFQKAAETDDLSKHPGLVRGMHEFVVVNIASLMHYTLVLSPEGPTLLKMMENVHRLLPYVVVRQTLKIGNVATMISAMMKVVLAKVSVASVTNWIGWSSGADEGMNLMQQIISQVLGWDRRDLNKRSEKIEKASGAPPKPVLAALKEWISSRSREEHAETRRMSQDQGLSIVAVILSLSSSSSAADELTKSQHAAALEYLNLQLSIRDRQEIIRVLCHRNPDHLTAMIQDGVAAYTPMIRQVHQAVNLSDTVWDFERFVTDMLKMSKPSGPKGQEKPPTVEDYVDLLHRHQSSSHKFLHQVAKNGKEVTAWWRDYVEMVVRSFRKKEQESSGTAEKAGQKSAKAQPREAVEQVFTSLSETDQKAVTAELDAHQKYLDDLHEASATRIKAVIERTKSTPFGPGAYLARWQALLDATLITPATAHGLVRKGKDKSVKEESEKDVEGNKIGFEGVEKIAADKMRDAPSVETTIRLFEERFRMEIAGGGG